jgi:hypothetical protein
MIVCKIVFIFNFPSGRIERIQGFEHYMLDELLQKENIWKTIL